ncbi:MAG: RimK/LysX family protein [Candidatus Brocadiaceae bacterium]|nr:RimK/LysX family protein [Candidatus Brocadiaceae bacterium]
MKYSLRLPAQVHSLYMVRFSQRFLSRTALFQPKNSFLLLSVCLIFIFTSLTYAKSKEVIGKAERILIYPGNIVLKAKIDTGAKICSINAPEFTLFERNEENWVRFELVNGKGEKVNIEERIIRTALLKRLNGLPSEKRPVIKLGICIGDTYKEVEVNLANRSRFMYQMLIGRNFLENDFLVDISEKYSKEPKCKSISGDE